jgi:hypothetical protein
VGAGGGAVGVVEAGTGVAVILGSSGCAGSGVAVGMGVAPGLTGVGVRLASGAAIVVG